MAKTVEQQQDPNYKPKIPRVKSNSNLMTENEDNSQTTSNRRIPEQERMRFLNLVTKKNVSMKNSAKIIGISYSAAKKIYGKFREQIKSLAFQKNQNSKMRVCTYITLQEKSLQNMSSPTAIISTIGGKTQDFETFC